jgi:hypothetical protein
MAAFDPEAELTHPVDYRLVANTFVTLFWRTETLERTVASLVAIGYDVVRVNATSWQSERDLHHDVAAALHFPDYYGKNLNALDDCLGDVASKEYGTSSQATGLALVITGYDNFAAVEPRAAHTVLDIVARQARKAALLGHRMMCLVQSDDPRISFGPVGATPVMWNDAEWLDSSRRPR